MFGEPEIDKVFYLFTWFSVHTTGDLAPNFLEVRVRSESDEASTNCWQAAMKDKKKVLGYIIYLPYIYA